MNIFDFYIPSSWLLFLLWFVYIAFHSKHDKNKVYVIFMWFFGVWLVGILSWKTHQLNYVRGKDVGMVTTESGSYVGYITKHPYKETMTVLTTPKYPILNCPALLDNQPMCEQELIEIKKSHVIRVEFLD